MSLTELRAALCDPAAYPDATATVETRETHISLVFLTEHHAYKIKKPVDLGFVDYSTEKRRYEMCQREITLNRRLSKGVYLGVDPIVRDGPDLRVGGQGNIPNNEKAGDAAQDCCRVQWCHASLQLLA